MKTENLDKLLDALNEHMTPLDLVPTSCIPQAVAVALDRREAHEKLGAFIHTRDVMEPPEKWGHRRGHAQTVARFCEAVIFYYMLRGAGCEAEIADHRELDVIMEILK